MSNWLIYSLLAFMIYGLWAFFPKLAVKYISPGSALVYEVAGALLVGFVVLLAMVFKVE